jgi:Sensors of blue-light using FAD
VPREKAGHTTASERRSFSIDFSCKRGGHPHTDTLVQTAQPDRTSLLRSGRAIRWYLQILEGERRQVITTYGRVQIDPRHGDISLLALHDVAVRSFPQWSMGGVMRSAAQQPVFVRHGIGEKLDPSRLMAPTILALALDLQEFELSIQPAYRLAG